MSRTSEVKQQLLGRTIEGTTQDMSASLPAYSETMEKPLSRFRRQGTRPGPSLASSLRCKYSTPTRWVGRRRAANEPDWPALSSLRPCSGR